jgi:hypothetical protein
LIATRLPFNEVIDSVKQARGIFDKESLEPVVVCPSRKKDRVVSGGHTQVVLSHYLPKSK